MFETIFDHLLAIWLDASCHTITNEIIARLTDVEKIYTDQSTPNKTPPKNQERKHDSQS